MSTTEICNTWNQCKRAGGDRIAITYQRATVACWHVVRLTDGVDIKTDPKGPWYNHGHKTFVVQGRINKKERLEEAIQWANKQFGKREFVRNRQGDYVEKDVNKQFPIRRLP